MTALAERNSWAAEGLDDRDACGSGIATVALGDDEPRLVRTLRGHRGGAVNSVSFSPSKKQLASGGADSCVMLWHFGPASHVPGTRPTRAYRFVGHRGAVNRVTFSPDGTGLASASSDRTVRLWETKARGESTELKGHGGPVRCVDYAPDARRLLTASDDKTVKIWALPQRKFLCTLGAGELGSPGAAKSPRLRGGAGSATTSHSNWVRAAKWAPDGRLCASASDDKLVKLWDVEGRSCVRTFFEHEGAVRDVAFSGDGTCVVSGGDDGKVNVWDARSHGLIQHYASHAGPITSIAMEPRAGHYLASSGDDGTLKLYDLRQGQVLYTLRGHEGAATAAAFSPRSTDGELFASGGADKVVMVWRTKLDGCAPQPPSTTKPRGARAKGGALKATTRGNKTPAPHHPAVFEPKSLAPPVLPASTHAPTLAPPPPPVAAAAPASPAAPPPAAAPRAFAADPDVENAVIEELVVPPDDPAALRAPFPRAPAAAAPAAPAAAARDPDHALGAAPRGVDRAMLPEVVASTLDHVVGQLDIITSTLAILEQRLSITEDRVSTILKSKTEEPSS
jgi:centriolar protein POC1